LYGNYFFYDMAATGGNYSVVAFINSTSQDAIGAYGAFIHEAFLKMYIGNPNL
jgi:hypothetical protein